jgi:hypothetical protein
MPNPVKDLPRVADLEAEFDDQIMGGSRPSWYEATEMVKNQITWLEYVPEPELSDAEVEHLIVACRKAFVSLRRLTARYID